MKQVHKSGWTFCCLVIAMLLLLASCANQPAATPPPQTTRDLKLEQTIENQLAGINPQAVAIYHQATSAFDAGEYQKAEQLYKQVISMAPNFSTTYRRLGYIELYQNKNRPLAIEYLRKAVALEPDAYNQGTLALILTQNGSPSEYQEAFSLASAAVKLMPDDEQANLALMLSAVTTNNMAIVRQADQHLLEVAPTNPAGHYFAGLLAADDGNWEKAEAELHTAQTLGMNPTVVQNALNNGVARNVAVIRFLRWAGIALVFWLAGLGILYLAGIFLSNATIRSLGKLEPTIGAQLQPAERSIRSMYRVVIRILSVYFYISIPFVILLLFFVVGGAFYLFFLIGSIPIQLAAILVIMLLASLFAILRAIFTRVKDAPPGKPVSRTEAPELWKLAEQVAEKMGTRPVDSIYVTPYAGIAVNERGGMLKKLRKGGQRNLLLGMAVLPGLNQGQLAAILAHEYGHFYNRDTAGGDLAYKVYASLNQMAFALARSGARQFFNPVWLFVVNYHKLYLRVTLGASRLQEVLADRFASMAYGRTNFVEGLQSIIRQAIAFELHANFEVRKSFELNQPINNLYQLPLQEELHGELETQFAAAMKRKTSAYDSHPAPLERIALIERMRIPYALDQDNTAPALELFVHPEELQQEMTSQLIKNAQAVIKAPR